MSEGFSFSQRFTAEEMAAITNRYKKVAGYDRQSLEAKQAAAG